MRPLDRARRGALVPPLVLLAACGGTVADGLGEAPRDLPEVGNVPIEDVVTGTCFKEPTLNEVFTIRVIACDDAHDAQAFHQFDLDVAGDNPGDEEVELLADEGCYDAFEDFVGISYDESELYFSWFSPLEEGWAVGDRAVLCYLVPEEGAPDLTEDAEGSER